MAETYRTSSNYKELYLKDTRVAHWTQKNTAGARVALGIPDTVMRPIPLDLAKSTHPALGLTSTPLTVQIVYGARWMCPPGICTIHCRPSFRHLGFGISCQNDLEPAFRVSIGLFSWDHCFWGMEFVCCPRICVLQLPPVCACLLLVWDGAEVRREVGRPQAGG